MPDSEKTVGKPVRVKTGDVFESWTVIEYRPVRSLCRCSCERAEQTCRNAALVNGNTKQCKECGLETCHKAHEGTQWRKVCKGLPWDTYIRLCIAVDNATARCTNDTRPQWKDWGGRGIKVLFTSRNEFIEYLSMLEGYDNPNLMLDRINNNGHYEPGNLRFTNRHVSNFNRRRFGASA